MGRRRGTAVSALISALLLAGCVTTVHGTASPARASRTQAPAPATVTPGPTSEAPVTPAPPEGAGRVLESHRIASVTSLIPVSFPDRTESCSPSGPLTTADAVETAYFSRGAAADLLDRNGFVAGWGQCGSRPGGGSITQIAVLELSDPDAAGRVGRELIAAQVAAGWQPGALGVDGAVGLVLASGATEDVQVLLASGRMLVYALHEAAAGKGLTEAAPLLRDQMQLLSSFTPTPQADVPGLPADPQGLAHLVLDPPGELDDTSGGYDLEGYLRLAIDPAKERDVLTANGFSGFYVKESQDQGLGYAVALYVFPASAQTNAVYTAFAQLETAAYGGTKFTLPAIPQAPCFSFQDGDTYYQRCYVGYGSYLASVDVAGLASAGDTARMNQLLPAQRDLIDG